MVGGGSVVAAAKTLGLGYFAEFFIFPPLILAATAIAFLGPNPPYALTWAAIFAASLAAWTLIEYLLHRFVLHHAPLVSTLHERHHNNPNDPVGTPVWASSLSALVFVVLPAWAILGFEVATAVTAGMATGYLSYVFCHYAAHYGGAETGSRFYRLRVRHARHHHLSDEGNFGVSTSFWDHVFGTALNPRAIAKKPR
jgi:sterol desaturase/sphingolipid hydroxylase (fatty acid hydroxylase superfamily)